MDISQFIKAAHLVHKSLSSEEVSYLFGVVDVAEDMLDHAEGCTTRSAEDEETLGLSSPVSVKEDITRSRKREMKKDDEGDSEDEENEDDDG